MLNKTVSAAPSKLQGKTVQGVFTNEVAKSVVVTVQLLCFLLQRRRSIHSRTDLSVPAEPVVSEGAFSRGFTVSMNNSLYFIKLGEPNVENLPENEDTFRKKMRIEETISEHRHVIAMMNEGVFTQALPCLVRPVKVGTFQSDGIEDNHLMPAILYEPLPDEPIHNVIKGFQLDRTFSLSKVQGILKNILPGIIHLHAKEYSIRDIGPHNMTETMLFDYGKVAKFDEGPGENLFIYLPYSPPERASSDPYLANFNEGLDLWQLGCTLFHLTMGCYPFEIEGDAPKPETIRRVLLLNKSGDVTTTKEGIYNLLATNIFCKFNKSLTLENCPDLALFCDFLTRLLQPNSSKRESAASLSTHPFLTSPLGDISLVLDPPRSAARIASSKPASISYVPFSTSVTLDDPSSSDVITSVV